MAWTLPAVLTHELAALLEREIKLQVLAQPVELVVDAAALKEFDSSALALLLACRREALAAGKTFSVRGLSARLEQLAGLYGISELIPVSTATAA